MTLGALTEDAARAFAAAGFAEPRLEARFLLAHLLGETPGAVFGRNDEQVTETVSRRFGEHVRRRLAREPAAYITRQAGFRDLDLEVSPAVLIPRPETETLVDAALEAIAGLPRPRILDLGTGSGAILLALLSARPDADGVGCDVSLEALTIAGRNAEAAGVGGRARFSRSSWWSHVPGRFDLVVANPPYIRTGDLSGLEPEVRDHEPHLALDGGPDGLAAFRAIASGAEARLETGGTVAVEIGRGQGDKVADLFTGSGFGPPRRVSDLAGIERVLVFGRA
jgi:release factor glutamine methyltransferase